MELEFDCHLEKKPHTVGTDDDCAAVYCSNISNDGRREQKSQRSQIPVSSKLFINRKEKNNFGKANLDVASKNGSH